MKRISTLLTAFAALFTVQASAQSYSNDFETALPSCYRLYTATPVTGAAAITGTSMATDPLGTSRISTPFLNFTGTATISFQYKLTDKLTGQATRTIRIGTTDANGVFTQAPSSPVITLSNTDNPNGNGPMPILNFPSTTFSATGIKSFTIQVTGSTGDGQTYVVIDNLTVTGAGLYYNTTCNQAPTAFDNNYASLTASAVSGNVLTDAFAGSIDSDPENESLTAQIVTQPSATQGTVSLSSTGAFIFIPAAGFTGGPVTFTYRVTDAGYLPATSNTATVTINYPALSVLPIKLMSFNGNIANNRARLTWAVAENETGDHFQVLRSNDGKTYSEAGTVITTNKVGTESYSFTDAAELAPVTYYKLKIVNKDRSVAYSNVIILKSAATVAGSSLTILQNPVGATLNFTYTSSTAAQSNVVIYNAAGAKVFSTRMATQKGANAVSFNLDSRMAPGTYILEVANATERSVTKLIKK